MICGTDVARCAIDAKVNAMQPGSTTPATLADLALYLNAERYQPGLFHIGSGWSGCGDTFCLEQTAAGFEAFYVERGQRAEAMWIEPDEAAACQAFVALLDREPWSRSHCVAFSDDLAEISRINELLSVRGIQATRNDIPSFDGPDRPRYRLFAIGKDKLIADQMMNEGLIPQYPWK